MEADKISAGKCLITELWTEDAQRARVEKLYRCHAKAGRRASKRAPSTVLKPAFADQEC